MCQYTITTLCKKDAGSELGIPLPFIVYIFPLETFQNHLHLRPRFPSL